MRNYGLDYDKFLGRIMPLYLSGNRLKLFLKSLLYPLQSLASAFASWGHESTIDASMTSQVIMLEWYLNYKFRQYFRNSSGSIRIENFYSDSETLPALYNQSYVDAHHDLCPALYSEGNTNNKILDTERRHMYSFYVFCPQPVSGLDNGEYSNMVKAVVNRYKLASKSFFIVIE